MRNIIGSECYFKSLDLPCRHPPLEGDKQAKSIASGLKDNAVNIRQVQGRFVGERKKGNFWGDNLGRIAEGLSNGEIQLQLSEHKDPKFYTEKREWTLVPASEAKGWSNVVVHYIYSGEFPSEDLKEQAEHNPDRILMMADRVFPNQYVGITKSLDVIVSDDVDLVEAWMIGDYSKGKEL